MSKLKLELELNGAKLVASELDSQDLVTVLPLFKDVIKYKLGDATPESRVSKVGAPGKVNDMMDVICAASRAIQETNKDKSTSKIVKEPMEVVSPKEVNRILTKKERVSPLDRTSTITFDANGAKIPAGKSATNNSKSSRSVSAYRLPSDEVLAKYGYKVKGHEEKKVVASSEDKTKLDNKPTKKLKQDTKFEDYSTTKLVAIKCEGCGDTIIKRVENDECEVYCVKCKTHNDINPLEKYPSAYYHCDCGCEMNIDEVINFKDTNEPVKSKCRKCKQELFAKYNSKDNTYYRY